MKIWTALNRIIIIIVCLISGSAFAFTSPGAGVSYTMPDLDAATDDVTRVGADITISAGDQLSLMSGDTLAFDDGVGLRVSGALISVGTGPDMVGLVEMASFRPASYLGSVPGELEPSGPPEATVSVGDTTSIKVKVRARRADVGTRYMTGTAVI